MGRDGGRSLAATGTRRTNHLCLSLSHLVMSKGLKGLPTRQQATLEARERIHNSKFLSPCRILCACVKDVGAFFYAQGAYQGTWKKTKWNGGSPCGLEQKRCAQRDVG